MSADTPIPSGLDLEDLRIQLLAVRCQLGEPAAFEELVGLWHLRLWAYLLRLVGEPAAAEDALQETWLRVLRDIPRLREPARLVSWIFGIARHVAVDALRRRRIHVDLDAAEVLQIGAPAEVGRLDASLAALESALPTLPFLEREVLTLFYLEELSLREVASILAVPEGTVKSRLFRARRLLQERLIPKGQKP